MQDLLHIPSCFFASGGDKAPPSGGDKPPPSDDPTHAAAAITKLGQSVVLTSYRTLIAGHTRLVTVTWCKNLLALGLYVSIETPEPTADGKSSSSSTHFSTCKVEMRPWHFWRRLGTKRFNLCNPTVDVFWDLKNAKFSDEPEPVSDYYVAVVSDGEVILLLGDMKHDAFRRTASRPSMFDPVLVSKKEHVFGKKKFVTRAKLDESARNKTHEICVECSSCSASSGDCEMLIRIDGSEGVRVSHLQWNFRGHERVAVDERMKVEVYWDVHDWLFGSSGLRHALFIFKPVGGGGNGPSLAANSSSSSSSSEEDFCLFLYAWKIE